MLHGTSKGAANIVLPIILGMAGTAILYSYITPWVITFPDSATYLRMAEEIQKGHWHIDQWIRGAYTGPPLYPMLVGLLEWVIPGFETVGTLVSIMAASVAVIPLFFLARHLFGEKAAWVAILLTILNPWYLQYVIPPLTESLFTLFFIAGVAITLFALSRNSSVLWFVAGIIGGAAWMTRDAGIILPFLSFLWFAISMWRNRYPFSKIVKNGIALALGVILIYAPLKILMTVDHKGIPDPPPNGSIAFQLMMPDLRDFMRREIYFGSLTADGMEYAFVEAHRKTPDYLDILRHWDWIVQRWGYNLQEVSASIWMVLGLILLVFVSAGIFRGKSLGRKNSGWSPGASMFLGSYVLLYLFFYMLAGAFTGALGSERYLVPLIPIWGIWAAAGILFIGEFAGRFKIKHLAKLITFLCVGIILITYFPGIKRIERLNRSQIISAKYYKRLGTQLRKISQSNYNRNEMVIMARSPFLPYYAGASWFTTPYGEYPEIMKFARSRDVDFLYLDKWEASRRPQLSFLLNSHLSLPEMERVYWQSSKRDPEELILVLYRIKK